MNPTMEYTNMNCVKAPAIQMFHHNKLLLSLNCIAMTENHASLFLEKAYKTSSEKLNFISGD